MTQSFPLCRADDIDERSGRGFTTQNGEKIFIIRHDDRFFAYTNRCPHLKIPLDWDDDQFLDIDKELIQCATHSALFLIETGECVSGPCAGSNLESVEIESKDGFIYLKTAVQKRSANTDASGAI